MKAHTNTQKANIARLVYDRPKEPGDGSPRYARTETRMRATREKKDPIRARLYNAHRGTRRETDEMPRIKDEKAYGVCIMMEG